MIETIKKRPGLGLRRVFARHLARQAGLKVMSPENPRQLARARIDKGGDRSPIAEGVTLTETTLAQRPALHFKPEESRPGGLLFLHGGGYVIGSPQSHKPFVSQLAHALRLEAWSLDYRLAPEDVCPAAIEDATDALAFLRTQIDGPLIVAGDSAGGGLALAGVIRHRDAGRRMPDGLYLISPWADLSGSGESTTVKAGDDPMLKPHYLAQGAALYLDGRDPRDPEASPLFADLSGLPPTLIQVGEDEILLEDSTRLAEKMTAARVEVTCQVWQAMWHDFQLFAPILPEAIDSLRHVKRWGERFT
jgi:monoterpene epsilon-lactone hydrolase